MLILTSFTAPLASLTTFSIIGCRVLHGPHHGAQKSTITGTVREASSTSLANLVWSLSLIRSAGGAAAGAAPFNIGSMRPRNGDSGVGLQCGPRPPETQGADPAGKGQGSTWRGSLQCMPACISPSSPRIPPTSTGTVRDAGIRGALSLVG